MILSYDTETTGLHFKNRGLADPSQPHLVQLSCLLVDAGDKRVVQSLNLVVRPDGWDIPQEAINVHGITNEFAECHGLPEKEVLWIFLQLWATNEPLRVAHNCAFDDAVISTAIARHYGEGELLKAWQAGESYCTMQMSKPIVQARNVRGALKYPKLMEAYSFFFNEEFDRSHSANADAVACMQIYFALTEDPLS